MIEPIWIEERQVLEWYRRHVAAHQGVGLRDRNLLLSALAKPKHLFAYSEVCTLELMAAAYTAGIARNHPFVDGNKRTAFAVGVWFLRNNRHIIRMDKKDAAEAILQVVAGQLDEAGYAAFLKAGAVNRPASL